MKITASLKNSTLYKECGIALTTWLLLFSFLLFQQPRSELTGYVALVFPYAIVFYWFCYAKLIPGIIRKQQDYRIYLLKVILTIALTALPIIAATSKLATGLYLFAGIFTLAFQLVFTAPIAWEVYHYRLRTGKEINRLKIALGRSDANFQFLQSQINPHFLFNALNTLLGTAMQEKAERTGEGIQMLGDMMRFLLHEQGKEFIPLKHEIDYLHRFIALQKLRIRRSPNILIEIMIRRTAGRIGDLADAGHTLYRERLQARYQPALAFPDQYQPENGGTDLISPLLAIRSITKKTTTWKRR